VQSPVHRVAGRSTRDEVGQRNAATFVPSPAGDELLAYIRALWSCDSRTAAPMASDGNESPATTDPARSPPSSSNTANVTVANETAALLSLLERTGYPLVQENGQRKYGPPPDWPVDKPPPARGCEVFVGKIPRDCFEVL